MCGIAGYTWFDNVAVNQIPKSLNHRGPDDFGFFVDDEISLIQVRLSILDLSVAGSQPMFYDPQKGACSNKHYPHNIEKSRLVIVFNGEIYNYPELRAKLKSKGYNFNSNCDTELILAAFLEWGEGCVNMFNGMWAFCIYDKRNKTLFLSRDRMGIKPLYYSISDKGLSFGSELKVFYNLNFPITVNDTALRHYFLFNYSPSGSSLIKNIKKLEAGTNLIFDLDKKEVKKKWKFWNPIFATKKQSLADVKKEAYELLDNAIKKRLLSDVEVGAFLSGGIDSSIIVYFMKKYIRDLKTFSIKFDYEKYNESYWANLVAEKFETKHFEIGFNANHIKDLIEKLPYYYDEPFGDSSMIPTYLVSHVASKNVKVILSGTGSDEIFGGYSRYNEFLLLSRLRLLPKFIKKTISGLYKLKSFDKASKLEELLMTSNNHILYLKLLSDLFRGYDPFKTRLQFPNELFSLFGNDNNLNDILCFDQNHYLCDDLLVKEDRATMAHSLEGRIPFLDYRLVEFANNLPLKFKINNGQGKFIIKELFKQKLPKEIINRKKKGFGVPLPEYFRNELKTYAEEIIFDYNGPEYYDKELISKIWKRHQEGLSNYYGLFWNILSFNKWFNHWNN